MMSIKEFFKKFFNPDFKPTPSQQAIIDVLDEHIKWDKENTRPKSWVWHPVRRGKFSSAGVNLQSFPKENLKNVTLIFDDPFSSFAEIQERQSKLRDGQNPLTADKNK